MKHKGNVRGCLNAKASYHVLDRAHEILIWDTPLLSQSNFKIFKQKYTSFQKLWKHSGHGQWYILQTWKITIQNYPGWVEQHVLQLYLLEKTISDSRVIQTERVSVGNSILGKAVLDITRLKCNSHIALLLLMHKA